MSNINISNGQKLVTTNIEQAKKLIDRINTEDNNILRTVKQMDYLGLSAKIETAHLGSKADSFKVISEQIVPLNLEIETLVKDSKKLSEGIKITILNIEKAIQNKNGNHINSDEYSALESKLKEIEQLIELIKNDDERIIKISNKINDLSLNATISSHHIVGIERKVFEVIADKISVVAKKINEFAEISSQDSESLIMILDGIIELVKKIYENQIEEENKTKVLKKLIN